MNTCSQPDRELRIGSKTTKDKQNAMKEEEEEEEEQTKQNHIVDEEDVAVGAPLDNIDDINSTTLARPFS